MVEYPLLSVDWGVGVEGVEGMWTVDISSGCASEGEGEGESGAQRRKDLNQSGSNLRFILCQTVLGSECFRSRRNSIYVICKICNRGLGAVQVRKACIC